MNVLKRTPALAMIALVVVALAQFSHFAPRLPERIVVHFGTGGANGWSDTRTFLITYGAVEAAIVVMALLVGRIMERSPASAINIPNRDYWLAEVRRRATVDYVTEQFLWMECLTLAFLIAVAQTIFKANLRGGAPTLPQDFWVSLVAFIAGVGWICVRIVTRFGPPPRSAPPRSTD